MAVCVICKNPYVSEKYRPFCCKRCADVDLYRWSSQSYTVPVDDTTYEDSLPEHDETTH